jgi:regulator of protease activity HflC (stomatin/prohibitin superfamily)
MKPAPIREDEIPTLSGVTARSALEAAWDAGVMKPTPIREIEYHAMSGLAVLARVLAMMGLMVAGLAVSRYAEAPPLIIPSLLLGVTGFVGLFGLFTVNPNEAIILQLFGAYKGTVKEPGLRWANPLYASKAVSLRVFTFECNTLKVNDRDGNPVQIAAAVVWKVVDTAQASFHVYNYDHFVRVQSEAALRNLATRYPYDAHDREGEVALRSHTAEVSEHLRAEIQDRLTQAGVKVVDARISHLAYAPEIAGLMLQRQQASAMIAARQKIVEGAVGMVEMALALLSQRKIVELGGPQKAEIISNLLVVLCAERGTQPTINAGSTAP